MAKAETSRERISQEREDIGTRFLIEEEMAKCEIAQLLYDARIERGISQEDLAALIGVSKSVIDDVEEADFQGDAIAVLSRAAFALDKRLLIGLTPNPDSSEPASTVKRRTDSK